MLFLRQSTASQAVVLGPFIDDTDGASEETGLTIANTDIRISKDGGNIVGKNSGGGTHDELGLYTVTFDATDTDTVGPMQVLVSVAGALPVYHEFFVLEEAIYDGLFASGATSVPADMVAISGNTAAADNLSASARTILTGTFTGTPTTTTGADTSRTEASDDHFIGRTIMVRGTENIRAAYAASEITDYDGTTKTFTWTAIVTAPNSGDEYVII